MLFISYTDDVTSRFDCVFWMGDLNFRLEKEREKVDWLVKGAQGNTSAKFETLLAHDELMRVRNEGEVQMLLGCGFGWGRGWVLFCVVVLCILLFQLLLFCRFSISRVSGRSYNLLSELQV